jgi:hypothetical protein
MDALLDMTLTFSQQMLEERGGFDAHGASIDASGELKLDGAYTGEEHPSDAQLIEILYDAFRARAAERQIRAATVATDVRLRSHRPGRTSPAMRSEWPSNMLRKSRFSSSFRMGRGDCAESTTANSSRYAVSRRFHAD